MTQPPESGQPPAAERPDVAPLDVDAVRTVQVGTAVWTVLLVALLFFRPELEADGRSWWIWTCVIAVVFGVIGIAFTTHRRRRIRERDER